MHPSDGVAVLDRRALLQRAIILAGGSALGISLEPIAETRAGEARFFTPEQFAILDAVADTIIPATDTPGARGVGVPHAYDAFMLNWASKAVRAEFTALLNDFDRTALAQEGKVFTALPAETKTAFLARYDKANFPKPWSFGSIGGSKSYAKFKELLVILYYLSEVGATQELRYEHDPGVWDPDMKVTPETRAWAVSL